MKIRLNDIRRCFMGLESADRFAGQTIAILRFLDLMEAQRVIEH